MENRIVSFVAALLLLVVCGQANAFNNPALASAQQQCYGVAMVGFDSVINSRMGVPPEHALDLATVHRYTPRDSQGLVDVSDIYGTYLLNVILSAYLWDGNPHSYAVSVFYRCARDRSQMQQALRD